MMMEKSNYWVNLILREPIVEMRATSTMLALAAAAVIGHGDDNIVLMVWYVYVDI
jgi:hypothetical protein